ncbi:hypothetical protein Ae168Ps1_6337c [Pseudonocardia sp. Ae168_Ps1]|uniref:hypothetical protein n=2 Tax=Pseudonocardia TaxID=1847 RepID=UPI00094B762B|nr:hypothetical protein [Pseudonocardia sp. Ae356_Ps1]OLL69921.1 hypothetical protein Ae150APs1_6231 [Pseudonocardia sp. Ae150A_Ps1]OLL70100.1 hypothetical protein Ae168Ps1_6337c [Pseudonocardia sp. Ae168_Ps1]OLL70371.1 hypothetical protein Ae263Ps1_6315c [Pseudonocardia sp. Ae263_Ps1]OLL89152.1 hypothetical protein Ae356Ps1_6180c [Pseudonocardia sp. Ae356_Ps1]
MARGRGRSMDMGEAITKAVRGQRTPRTTTTYRQIKDLIKTYGDRDAADRLGVSARTLRTWVHPDRSKRRAPSKANRGKIGTEHGTREVRRATAPRRRLNRLGKKGIKVNFTGQAGPTPMGKDYRRLRKITADLPPDAAEAIMNAYVEDGPAGAEAAFREAMREHYHDADWQFSDPQEFRFDDSDLHGDGDEW